MTGAGVLNELALLGVRVWIKGEDLMAGPPSALTPEARALIRQNREVLRWAVQGFESAYDARSAAEGPEHHLGTGNAACAPVAAAADISSAPRPSCLSGPECTGCARLRMREEPQEGTRRRFFWRCDAGHAVAELRRYGGTIITAPPECTDYEQWAPGTM